MLGKVQPHLFGQKAFKQHNNLSFNAKKKAVQPKADASAPVLEHNLQSGAFKWLFAKYVRGMNEKHHCTNGLIGSYSDKIGASKRLKRAGMQGIESTISFDEKPAGSYDVIYICGVAKKGYDGQKGVPYWEKENYQQNLHAVIKPVPGKSDQKLFCDKWLLKIKNGIFLSVPEESELPARFKQFSDEFKKCRMFRWAAGFYDSKNTTKKG